MATGYIQLNQKQPPVDMPIICRFYQANTKRHSPHGRPNAMSKAIRRADGKIYYHADNNLGIEIESPWIEWKRC